MPERRATIIVTGSGGFIGRAVCRAFVSDGYEVIGLDRADAMKPQPGVTDIHCDLTSEQSVADAISRILREFGQPLASVIHLAAYYDFSGEPSPRYEQVTVQGTERLLRLLKTARPEQFVFSSTMLVHAPCEPGEHVNENGPIEPKWDYPQSKVKTEKLIRAEHESVPVVLLRIAGVYTDRCQSLPLAHQMQRIYERRLTSKVFPGDTSTGQSFVHLDDVVAVAKAGAWLQDQIPGVEEPFIKPWMIDLADDHYALDISRARQLLGWSPRHSLKDTLPRMVAALKTDPEGFYRLNKLEGASPHHEAAPTGHPAKTRTRS